MFERLKNRNLLVERPIPLELPSVAGWKEIPIKECAEPLIPLGSFSNYYEIYTDSIYFGERKDSPYGFSGLYGSLVTTFVRESIAKQLRKAQRLLPKGKYLVVFDAYRTLDVQRSLFSGYFNPLKEQHPDWTEDQLLAETQKYVSLPSKDPTRPSPHNTGGSVDLAIVSIPQEIEERVREINQQVPESSNDWRIITTLEMRKIALIKEHAELLKFGTQFDWGGEEAALNYFERKSQERGLAPSENEAKNNRRLLYHVMTEAGFEPYEDEWWHYNSKKSQMGAKTSGRRYAEYGAVQLSPDNEKFNLIKSNHWWQSNLIFWLLESCKSDWRVKGKDSQIIYQAIKDSGDPRLTSIPIAAINAPPRS